MNGSDALKRMRDEMAMLVTAWNTAGECKKASHAQGLVLALAEFEDRWDLSELHWPPSVAEGEYGLDMLPPQPPSALEAIAAERVRQRLVEGFDAEHDEAHLDGELAAAAAMYALHNAKGGLIEKDLIEGVPLAWPFAREWWKPKSPRADLVRAGALIVAEIERLDKLAT